MLAVVLIGFIAMIILTHNMDRQSATYQSYLIWFLVFLIVAFIIIFAYVVTGIKMNLGGKNFGRKIYVLDPQSKTHVKEIFDDGTYVIKDGKINGRINISEAEKNEDMLYDKKLEPQLTYIFRVIFLGIACIALVFITFFALIILLVVCYVLTFKFTGKDVNNISEGAVVRNGRLMNAMTSIPYSRFLLREAQDCPICLESFQEDSQVV